MAAPGREGRGGRGGPLLACIALALLLSCAAFPAHPALSRAPEGAPPMELAALAPAILAAMFLITLVLLLSGCVCCRRNKFTANGNDDLQFTNAASTDISEMAGVAAVSNASNAPVSPIDTGIVNPIVDREFTIFGPLSPENLPRPHGNAEISPELPRIAQLQFFGLPEMDNNNPPFENNNNGPISPQELENIVNNNAENYIVSEYENLNVNHDVDIENAAVEEPQYSRAFSPPYPLRNVEDFPPNRLEDHRDWFENPNNYFSRNQLQYMQEIGRGWFGRIIEAEARNLESFDNEASKKESQLDTSYKKIMKVAVKILDENVSIGEKCIFLDECKLYKNANNANVLKFLGYNLSQDPWIVLFEYCPLGDLKTFLKCNKSNMATLSGQGIPSKFQCEITSALSYLHSQNVVHPDVACHSCMVTENLTAKLGDYGGAKHLHPLDFYNIFDKSVPLRWIAPESWMDKISKESNMWSLGVFLWESCTWATQPYENLNDEQVISSVLCQNGLRLYQPTPITAHGSYLYRIMQSCWQENPADRINAAQTLSLLQYIYSNHFEGNDSQRDDTLMQNFNDRWQNLKPNNIPKIDNGYMVNSQDTSMKSFNFSSSDIDEEKISKCETESICPPESEGSTDVLIDDFSEKTKSDSLNNLHGSLESIQEKSVVESNQYAQNNKYFDDSASIFAANTRTFICNSSCEVAPWLQDLPVNSQEDMSYIKTVSDVISDLDNMLSSEKTSSSESSHQTSPSRDLSNNTVSSNKERNADHLYCEKESDVQHNDTNNRLFVGGQCITGDDLSDASLDNANIGSHNINSATQKVPELNTFKNNSEQDIYPTLDFRLDKLDSKINENSSVYPIFQTKYLSNSQDYDSLQDSSYIPDDTRKSYDTNDDKVELARQCSSGSETEDEIWKKRIEMGTITEKIKLKSKSVTDFMVLTHIDMDFTDLESEDTSFTSVDGKFLPPAFEKSKKRNKYDPLLKDSSLPVEEYLSCPRNFSFSLSGRGENMNKPEFDMIKLKKSLWNMTLRNIRPTKSLNDLSSVHKNVLIKDLLDFKKTLDPFLDKNTNESHNLNTIDALVSRTVAVDNLINKSSESSQENSENNTWETTKYLSISEDYKIPAPENMPSDIVKREPVGVVLYESQNETTDIMRENSQDSTSVILKSVQDVDESTTSTPNINSHQNDLKIVDISPLCHENLPHDLNIKSQNLGVCMQSPCENEKSVINNENCENSHDISNYDTEFEDTKSSVNSNVLIVTNIESGFVQMKPIHGQYSVTKLEQCSVDENILREKSVFEHADLPMGTNVLLGPFADCTLDLYTGLKTDFKDHDSVPEEEALMFSTNFNDNDAKTNLKSKSDDFTKKQENIDVSSAYFFNSPATSMKSMSENKPVDYSLETWDRFLGSSFEDISSQNFDSIFPDVNAADVAESCSKSLPGNDSSKNDIETTELRIGLPIKDYTENKSQRNSDIENATGSSGINHVDKEIVITTIKKNTPCSSITLDEEEINSFTSKLAIAENENNLNIEHSLPQNLEEFVGDEENLRNPNNQLLNDPSGDNSDLPNTNSIVADINSTLLTNDDLPPVNNESSHDSQSAFDENNSTLKSKPENNAEEKSAQGWFLHRRNDTAFNYCVNKETDLPLSKSVYMKQNTSVPFRCKDDMLESPNDNSNSDISIDPESVEALRTELELKLPLAQLMGQCLPQIDQTNLTFIGCEDTMESPSDKSDRIIDPESVKAIRTELELKLPLVQQMSHENSNKDHNDEINYTDTGMQTVNINTVTNPNNNLIDKPLGEPNNRNNDGQASTVPDLQAARNEVLIHYNLYGVIPSLSPIQEESWSEFSDIGKGGDFEKSDTSNSLSLGQLNSMVMPDLPLDNNNVENVNSKDVENLDEKLKTYSDDDTNDDSHGSNQTFVALDGFESTKLDKHMSLSVDSLNCIDDQIDLDCENDIIIGAKEISLSEVPFPSLPSSELLSPFYEDHSNTKSTEEISQNLDNLLENITKTLENASKVGSVSECVLSFNLENDEQPSQNISPPSSPESGSKTYVIDGKNIPVNDLTYVCPNKVFDIPDDLSNVSKISQPSFVSDLNTSNISESQLKPSEKSISQILHTKTPSMDSWCSNDTLFNVEENFDDICSFHDFADSPDKCVDYEFGSETPKNVEPNEGEKSHEPISCAQMASQHCITKQPSLEMVMQNFDNTYNITSQLNNTGSEIFISTLEHNCTSMDDSTQCAILDSPKMQAAKNISDESESNILNASSGSNTKQSDTVLEDLKVSPTADNSLANTIEDDKKIPELLISMCSDQSENMKCDNIAGNSGECENKDNSLFLASEISALNSPKISESTNISVSDTTCIAATSTPLSECTNQDSSKKPSDMSQDSLDSAENIIEAQFEFLDNMDAPMVSLDDDVNFYDSCESPKDEINPINYNSTMDFKNGSSIINFVSLEQNLLNQHNLCNITNDFIQTEKSSIDSNKLVLNKEFDTEIIENDDSLKLKILNEKDKSNIGSIISETINSPEDKSINYDNLRLNDQSMNQNDYVSCKNTSLATPDHYEQLAENLSYSDFHESAEKKIQDSNLGDYITDSSIDHSSFMKSNYDDENVSNIYYDDNDAGLLEYLGHSGLDMQSFNDKLACTPKRGDKCESSGIQNLEGSLKDVNNYKIKHGDNETSDIKNLFSSGLSNIHFSGPINESNFSIDNSYTRDIKAVEDINTIAPECLKDWDSGSDESNANSSSSGEFTWKKGDAEEPITLSATLYIPPEDFQKFNQKFSGGHDFHQATPEEPLKSLSESSDESSDEEEIAFVPSSWNYLATPAKSSLKSPDNSQIENKKKVVFKKQKYPRVYEYPRELSDNEGDSPHLMGSSYMDWRTLCNNGDFDPHYEKYSDSTLNRSDALCAISSETPDDDFFSTSSTYDLLTSYSQFFPGQHLSLLNTVKPYNVDGNEIDDDEPLPPIPSELLLVKTTDNPDDANNIITTILENAKASDFITPDSGTEDVTPGSIEYEFKDTTSAQDAKFYNKNDAVYNPNGENTVDLEPNNALSNQELRLNIVNKNRSSPNCGILILPEKGSPSGSLTPSTPSPLASGNSSHSSGSTSPLPHSSILGGLRHTRDKLKLDLPPSPLARNSPSQISAGKNPNGEMKVFDFKNIESYANDLNKSKEAIANSSDASENSDKSIILISKKKDVSVELSNISSNLNNEIDLNSKTVDAGEILDSTNSLQEIQPQQNQHGGKSVNDIADIPQQKWSPSNETHNLDVTTLQKAVIPINLDENHKKSILEPVKGEGTLLDSGDEDSGIGSSAYTTLERKIESAKIEAGLIPEIGER